MNNRTNIVCLLLAVAGLSFGIGQTVGQDRAEAGAQSAKVLKVKDAAAKSYLQLIFRMQVLMNDNLKDITATTKATCESAQFGVVDLTSQLPSCNP